MKRMSRRKFIGATAAIVAGAGGYGALIEPQRLDVTSHRLNSANSTERDPILRVAHITDLHLQQVNAGLRRLSEAVHRARPHLIVLTGDSIDDRSKLPQLAAFLATLPAKPMKLATLGNWEHWARVDIDELSAQYRRHGCRLLVNETAGFSFRGAHVLITGLDDSTGGVPRMDKALSGITTSPNHLLLAHSPAFRDNIVAANGSSANGGHTFTCVLSGHTHGGQVAAFGFAPLRPPGSGRYVAGWYRDAEPHLYVSRGIGTSVLPVRFGATPELALFEWRVTPDHVPTSRI